MSIGEFDDRHVPLGQREADFFPCTLLQERLWALHKQSGARGLNVAMRWLVDGRLSHATAQAALRSLVRRHEILRTGFREISGRLVQIVRPACTLKLRDIDLSFLPADESETRAEEIARIEAIEPFDPRNAPLLRATLLRFGPSRGILMLTFHSLVADGWSIGLLVREFQAAASAIESGASPDASEPDLQFVDYALWERELLASNALDQARAYWRRQLRDATGTRVPPDRSSADRGSGASRIASILLPGALGHAIDQFARAYSVTLYSLTAAALALVLHRVTGEPEIVFGSQVANREDAAAETLIGPTVNSITLRLPVDDAARLGGFARTVADQVREALQHQRVPFEVALTYAPVRDGRSLHAINLVVHRSYSGVAETEAENGRFRLVSLPSHSSGTQWDLNFFLIGRDEGWRLSCEADPDLYEPDTVASLLRAWHECLEALVTAPDGFLATCPALDGIPVRGRAPRQLPPQEARELIPVHDPSRQIVRFHEGGSSTPMVVLNNRSVYYQLARHLGEDTPFIDIQLYHPTGPLDLPPHAFEVFAAYALRLIRWARPTGPCILGGHCVYGVLAFEIARQLRRMGETVPLVALFDSWAPGYREAMSPRDKKARERRLRLHAYAERLAQFRRGEIGLNEIVRKPILRRLGLMGPDLEPEKIEGQWFDEYLRDAVSRYRPKPYEGEVVLFRSRETLRGRLFDNLMGWGPLVTGRLGKVEVHSAHLDMFREQPAGEIAAALRGTLAEQHHR